MNSMWKEIPALLPEYGFITIVLTLAFLLAGWIASISVSVKHNWIVLLAFIPITNPIALVLLITKKATNVLVPVVFYALAFIVWFAGSRISNETEQDRLNAFKNQLIAQGDPTTGLHYKKPVIDPDLNVWHHPFLSAFIEAGQQEISGIPTNSIALPTRKKFKFPSKAGYVRYHKTDPGQHPFAHPFRRINEYALNSILAASDGQLKTNNLPTTPEASAAILKDTMDSMEEDLTKLREAVFRPDTILPRSWENGLNILLPELSELKRFNQVVSLHCIYHVIRGEQELAFDDAQLGFRLAQVTDSDILISRLVQMAQTIFVMEAINAAQTYHTWTDAQWQELESMLNTFNFIAHMPASIRCERAIGFDSIEPMLSKSGSDVFRAWENFLDPTLQKKRSTVLYPLEEFFFHQYAQAVFAKNWRLCLNGYSKLIADLDRINNLSRTTPWKKLLEERKEEDLAQKKAGFFGRVLLPSLHGVHIKAMKSQLRIEIAKVSIALERHFLRHESYPKTLEALKNEFPHTSIKDPMTGDPLHYKRSNDGYEIYSVGLNGKDDNGMQQQNVTRDGEQAADDVLWIVGDKTKTLPSVTLKPMTAPDTIMDLEMMKRYGLIPIDSK